MNLINATKMQAGYTMGIQPNGRELLVVVVKGTFTIPLSGEEPRLAEEQVPLVMTDVFTGEPGYSAPLCEIDFAPRKPCCDVLLNGSAYAPGGKPTDRITVSLRVGSMTKSFDVVGKRVWKAGALYVTSSTPEPFTVMPISYNNAFGGVDKAMEDPMQWRYYPLNHAGVGYHEYTSGKYLDGKPLPNTEETGQKITNPKGTYKPMAFGPLGRAWRQRVAFAGTYDQKWLDNTFPFLPADFDERYYQAAPADQQIDYPRGGEELELSNLTAEGRTRFRLPALTPIPVIFFRRDGEASEAWAVADTLNLEPDARRFLVSFRASHPIRRTIREIKQMAVGRSMRYWRRLETRRQRASGKRHFASLADLAGARREVRGAIRP